MLIGELRIRGEQNGVKVVTFVLPWEILAEYAQNLDMGLNHDQPNQSKALLNYIYLTEINF